MDLVKGVPITRYCDEHHLTPRQRLELFIPVCQAVQHAHQKGIIHRDLKPSNVLVALYDGKPVPKIIDFGVAKAAGQQLTDKTLVTGFGAIVGTLEYMSPEQAEVNQLDIDTRSDIYSLGVLLYELLTGSPPFCRKELTQAGILEMLRVIREQEPTKPSTKLSTAEGLPTLAANRGTEPAKLTKLVRGELDWIVMKALEKDRNRRYETANAFAMDVERYLADEPVQACPPSAGYRLRKFARRNKGGLAVAALSLFFLVLLGSGAGWVVRDRSAREAELREAVTAALDKVTDLRQRARWGEAQAVLEQVRQRLGPSGADGFAASGGASGGRSGAGRPAGGGAAESVGVADSRFRHCLGGSGVRGGVSGSGYRRGDGGGGGRGGSDSIKGGAGAVGGGRGRLGRAGGQRRTSATGLVVGGGAGGGPGPVAQSFSGCGGVERPHGPGTSGPRGEGQRTVAANPICIGDAIWCSVTRTRCRC